MTPAKIRKPLVEKFIKEYEVARNYPLKSVRAYVDRRMDGKTKKEAMDFAMKVKSGEIIRYKGQGYCQSDPHGLWKSVNPGRACRFERGTGKTGHAIKESKHEFTIEELHDIAQMAERAMEDERGNVEVEPDYIGRLYLIKHRAKMQVEAMRRDMLIDLKSKLKRGRS